MSIYYNPDDPFLIEMGQWFKDNHISHEELKSDANTIIEPWNKGKIGLQIAWNKGKSVPENVRKKISVSVSKSMTGISKSEQHKRNAGKASGKARIGIKIKASQQRKEKIGQSNSKEWLFQIDGKLIVIKNLKRYCKENNLSYVSMRKKTIKQERTLCT